MNGVVAPAPFSPAPPPCLPAAPAALIAGGPLLAMHQDLVAQLQCAFPPSQFAYHVMRARLTPQEWGKITARTPAIALGFVKMTPPGSGAVRPRVWSGRAHWALFLVAKSPRTDSSAVLGDGLGVGLMGMLAVATCALQGRSIAGFGSAEVGEGAEAYSEGWAETGSALAVLNVSVPFDMIDAAGLAQLDDFLRLGVRWPGVPDQVVDVQDNADLTEAA